MVGHDITKGDALFSPYRYSGQLYSIIYGQAIPSVIGQMSVALTLKKAMKEIMATSLLIKKSETTLVIPWQDIQLSFAKHLLLTMYLS